MKESLIVLLFAVVLDLYLGDPVYPLHPVRIMGFLINRIESLLHRFGHDTFKGGVSLILIVLSFFLLPYIILCFFLSEYILLINIFLVYSCIAIGDLRKHGKAVGEALENNDLVNARKAVQKLIGRDANKLDFHGVGRAAVESLAESFIDGFLAPMFWFFLGCLIGKSIGLNPSVFGVCFILSYRVVNTLDSMVGYKNEKYQIFGRASARLDDAVNYIPARLGIPIISIAAGICKLNGKSAWSIAWRDRLKHSSPNAGHAESCVAGALNIRLGGPGFYPHGLVEKPWLGDGTSKVSTEHLNQASYLILCSAFLATAFFTILILVF